MGRLFRMRSSSKLVMVTTVMVVMTVPLTLADIDSIRTDTNAQTTALMLAVMMMFTMMRPVAMIAIAGLGRRRIHADGKHSRKRQRGACQNTHISS